jgi:hypothetical protein
MTWLQTPTGFMTFLVVQLLVVMLGWRQVGSMQDQALRLGQGNRGFEQSIRQRAIDAESIRARQQINQRLRRAANSLEQALEFHLDEDAASPLTMVGGVANPDPNRFQDAVRAVREEYANSQLRFPATLGFSDRQPTSDELRVRVLQLDSIRQILRAARSAGLDAIVAIEPELKLNLIDDKNFLQFARVAVSCQGHAPAIYRFMHLLLRPGKYLSIDKATFRRQAPQPKRGQPATEPNELPQIELLLAAQLIDVDQPGMHLDPATLQREQQQQAGTLRPPMFQVR